MAHGSGLQLSERRKSPWLLAEVTQGSSKQDCYASKDSPLPRQQPHLAPSLESQVMAQEWSLGASAMPRQSPNVWTCQGQRFSLVSVSTHSEVPGWPRRWTTGQSHVSEAGGGQQGNGTVGLQTNELQPPLLWCFSRAQSPPVSSNIHIHRCSRSFILTSILMHTRSHNT